MDADVSVAIRALKDGRFVLIHDSEGRENEVDLAVLADRVSPATVAQMRRDAGGLICVALHPRIADNFGLPYLMEIYDIASSRFEVLKKHEPTISRTTSDRLSPCP